MRGSTIGQAWSPTPALEVQTSVSRGSLVYIENSRTVNPILNKQSKQQQDRTKIWGWKGALSHLKEKAGRFGSITWAVV